MDQQFLAIALLALSTVLIIAEVFIPSGGLLAIGTFASLGAAFYFAWQAWWGSSPGYFFAFTGFAIVFLPAAVIAAFAILPRTRFGKRILLAGPSEQEVIPFAAEEARLRTYVGRRAKTATPLTPNGFVLIDNERVNASSQGTIIDPGVEVEIIKASGTRVVVREAEEPEEVAPADEPDDDLAEDDESLDFDLPKG